MVSKRRPWIGSDRRRLVRGGRRSADCLGRYPSVLVADSNDVARRSCAEYLARFGFSVAEAVDGDDLMARIVIAPPRVILTESRLRCESTDRLAQWLQQSSWTRHVPVLLMAHDSDAKWCAQQLPAAAVLFKPFSLDAMLDRVRGLLRARDAERDMLKSEMR
jgi:DNA-binding response OmpR family regulator